MNERLKHNIELITKLVGMGLLSQAFLIAFSRQSRETIWRRDRGMSQHSGETEGLECAHYDHTRDESYDNPKNGRLLTRREHYMEHYMNHGRNGLSLRGNMGGCMLIWNRLTIEERRGLPLPHTLQ